MKKITIAKPKEIRKSVIKDSDNTEIIDETLHKTQKEIINKIYLGIDSEDKKQKQVISDIKKKMNSYKTQDQKKDRFVPKTFINSDEIYEKLVASKLKCYYCSQPVKLLYNYVRDDYQWTLDRINNDLGHSSDNTVISCLKCNLKRRVTDAKKFEFTKKLKLVKGS